jgi:RNA polymerase sigma factor (sigma-70 family)
MTTPKDGPGPPHLFAEAEWAPLYETLGTFLQGLLTRTFDVPERDAEWMVRNTFIDYGLNKPAPNARAWLIAMACREANGYRRRRGLPAANEVDVEPHTAAVVSVRDAMERLPSRAREALRLRYEKNRTYAEIGGELGISAYAAERFVERSLSRLRGLFRGEGTREP